MGTAACTFDPRSCVHTFCHVGYCTGPAICPQPSLKPDLNCTPHISRKYCSDTQFISTENITMIHTSHQQKTIQWYTIHISRKKTLQWYIPHFSRKHYNDTQCVLHTSFQQKTLHMLMRAMSNGIVHGQITTQDCCSHLAVKFIPSKVTVTVPFPEARNRKGTEGRSRLFPDCHRVRQWDLVT